MLASHNPRPKVSGKEVKVVDVTRRRGNIAGFDLGSPNSKIDGRITLGGGGGWGGGGRRRLILKFVSRNPT